MPILADLAKMDHAAVHGWEIELLLERQLEERAPSDAICWTLFIWRQLTVGGKTLPTARADEVIDTRDCMAIASLWAIGQATNRVIRFVRSLKPEEYDRFWLLVHEVGDEVEETWRYRNETGLELLADEGVSFIDQGAFAHTEFEAV